MIKKIIAIVAVCLGTVTLSAQDKFTKSSVIKLDVAVLEKNKAILSKTNNELLASYENLLKQAKKSLEFKPVSVMDKVDVPPSGDKHDYMSIAPYWWPDPSKPNGVPYMRKDGEVNPEVKNYSDKDNMPKMCEHIYVLGLAYYYSNDEQYAKHASELIKVWFLNSATKMNPNANFGQAVKGRSEGRGEGVLDTRHFIFVIDAVSLLKNSKSWSTQNTTDLKKWFSDYLHWMQSSVIGIEERDAKNNHGIWYDAQALAYALFTDNKAVANETVTRAAARLDKEMDDKGFFPYELQRTTSMGYSVFILNAFNVIAELSTQTDLNLWKFTTPSGKSLQKGFDAMLPYLSKKQAWTGQQIKPFTYGDAVPLLWKAISHYDCKSCTNAIKEITGDAYKGLLINLL
ncbi:alginate lyase family protein [Ferruginibacter yonginensis]|uniref:Alginate lyase family protein n=1 Tax=Ferruginibacter yonginensis TaxID=1310416 RepID=A0ABV8QR19_9BACT